MPDSLRGARLSDLERGIRITLPRGLVSATIHSLNVIGHSHMDPKLQDCALGSLTVQFA
jgi:hypothetical protein